MIDEYYRLIETDAHNTYVLIEIYKDWWFSGVRIDDAIIQIVKDIQKFLVIL